VGYQAAPDSLRARIAALANVSETSNRRTAPRASPDKLKWAVAAALAAILIVAGGVYRFLPVDDDIAGAVVAGHIRGQLSDQPVDVASSDRHTVKPWLAAKVPLATVVVDLAGDGFPLAGGRVDIVRGAAVPTLVYRRREHLVSVTELAPNRYPTTPRRDTIDGYPVLAWSDGQRSYLAVSDLPAAEVESFVALFRRAVASEQEGAPSPH
jgi:anti-sigma factor RsiW